MVDYTKYHPNLYVVILNWHFNEPNLMIIRVFGDFINMKKMQNNLFLF